eukprot:TRINITY_DN1028_c2_g1_i1.p1 TRINITY_DN1028_c2_g1~~TRINITY_DN1028_c2_g1_i1.p1  ORF type:complete len:293 (+),score=83.51 TRINITY_DN1028_c2_g1_i1:16-894(+)
MDKKKHTGFVSLISSNLLFIYFKKKEERRKKKKKIHKEKKIQKNKIKKMSNRNNYNDSESDSEEATRDDDGMKWISWFCGLKGNEFFCEVDEEYIKDDFNLTGLRSIVPNYEYAIDLILDNENLDDLSEEQREIIESAADFLYGLIHARFILTHRGMSAMAEKFRNVDFGRCPRVLCNGANVLPIGQTDQPRINTVKIFCPKCEDIYYPRLRRHSNIDGAYFGTTFAHLLLQTCPELLPPKPTKTYVPRIYGFKIHPSARIRQEERAKQIREQNRRKLSKQMNKKKKKRTRN